MKQKKSLRSALRRLEAALLAAGTLWIAAVTAGSDTAAAAVSALAAALPERALRWELGDLGTGDGLSPAAALAIGESSLLLSARGDVAELQALERQEQPEEDGETNFSRTLGLPYARCEGGIAVYCDGAWQLFTLKE